MTKKRGIVWIALGALVLVLVLASCAGLVVLAATLQGENLSGQPAVAIVRVEGVIMSGSPPINPFGASEGAYSGLIVDRLKQAEEDPSVRAVVLRVDSPGGGVVASDEIHQQVLAMTKPVVVSMGELAASGGYYVSAPADEVLANPNTLTGSIGVIAQFLNLSGLLEEYGVQATVIKSGEFKDEGSLFRPMTEEERAVWQAIIDDAYEEFVQVVADGRGMPVDEVKELADGRVFTGEQAFELGLVDRLGNLPDAVQRAAELGGIQGEPRIVEYQQSLNWFQGLFGLARLADPLGEVVARLERRYGPSLQYLYMGP
jgi:protease-4